jgi:hypothetical protein
MNCPIFLIYYTNKPNKLFAIEVNGKLVLPVFNDIHSAEKYKNKITDKHKENNEEIALMINVCNKRTQASELIKALYSDFDFRHYLLNPTEVDSELYPLADLILDLESNKD